ncbi:MAG: AraC family transcriptional regulator [Eubacteriales bacterium]|nr:AraC family transcriptional regulator [Eubacteriales bacterium]
MMEAIKDYKDLTDFPARNCLQVNTCGIRRVIDHDLVYLRSHGRHDYLLLYIKSGWLSVEIDGEMIRVDAGHCLIYRSSVRQMYVYSTQANPVAYYCHFVGPAADEAIAQLQPQDRIIYEIVDRTALEGLFHQLTQVYYTELFRVKHKPIFNLEANGILLQLIGMLARNDMAKTDFGQNKIWIATEYFIEHFREDIDLTEYASSLNLSISRFAHLFTQKSGISPHKFILNLRMDEAKELLLSSQMNVNEISESVGFSDPSYFSRLFCKSTGYSPTQYRNRTPSFPPRKEKLLNGLPK